MSYILNSYLLKKTVISWHVARKSVTQWQVTTVQINIHNSKLSMGRVTRTLIIKIRSQMTSLAWIYERVDQSRNHHGRLVVARPSQQRCSQWTRYQQELSTWESQVALLVPGTTALPPENIGTFKTHNYITNINQKDTKCRIPETLSL